MCEKLDQYFKQKKNITYERYIIKNIKQNEEESTVSFVTRLRKQAEYCAFSNVAEAVKDQFISECHSVKLKQKFLKDREINIDVLKLVATWKYQNNKQKKCQIRKQINAQRRLT